MTLTVDDDYVLTPKEQAFCNALLADPDQIAIRAYKRHYSWKTDKSAQRDCNRILKRPRIKEYLKARRREMQERSQLEQERVLQELAAIALLDPADFYGADGDILAIHDMPEGARRSIAQFETFTEYEGRGKSRRATGVTTKIRLIDKIGAIDRINKMLGFNAPEKQIVEDGLSKLMDHIAQNATGSTIGRLNAKQAVTVNVERTIDTLPKPKGSTPNS